VGIPLIQRILEWSRGDSNPRPPPCKGRGLRSKAVGPTAKVRRREVEPITVGVSSRLGGPDGSTDGDRIPPQHTSTRHNPFLGGFRAASHRITPPQSDYESEGRRFESCRARS
jgi:hypothetical protein